MACGIRRKQDSCRVIDQIVHANLSAVGQRTEQSPRGLDGWPTSALNFMLGAQILDCLEVSLARPHNGELSRAISQPSLVAMLQLSASMKYVANA